MINRQSFDRLTALGRDFIAAAQRLEDGLRELSTEADAQLADAARAFLAEHDDTSRGPMYASYTRAHRELVDASIASSNVRDTLVEAVKARADSRAFVRLQAGGQFTMDMRRVCNNAPATPRETSAEPGSDPGSQACS